MARPIRIILESGIAAWDADIDALFALIYDAPFPMHIEPDVGTLTTNFDPTDYEDCLVLVGATGASRIYISDGVDWNLYDKLSANVPASTATTVELLATDYNSLLTALKTAGLMASS
jgi:hypothetical protein